MTIFGIWLVALCIDVCGLSILTGLSYAWDKRQAKRRAERIPENRLHLFALLGGWPGGLLAQLKLRHKTRKISFQILFWLTVIGHITWAGGVTMLFYLYDS